MDPAARSFGQITTDLEALKAELVGMTPADIDPAATTAMAQEISAIRLHLKRLEFERQAVEGRRNSARS